ncbi:MAG: hypothetical protein IKQ41_11905 [Clostridia bacterium]|nr:hypothetical protein [Clostridia bacterium]
MRSKRFQRFLRALLSAILRLALGLALGYVEMTLIAYFHPAEGQASGIVPALTAAFEGGLMPMLRGGSSGFLTEAAKAAPAALLAIGVAFSWRAGLYQLGGAGQYALGAAACAACFTFFALPWYACLLVSAAAGCWMGAVAGWMKNRFRVHEGLSTAMMAWIGIYAVGAAMQCFSASKADFPGIELPAALLPAAAALLLWLGMALTAAGWAHGTRGESERIARYAGMDTGKITVLTLTISAALSGIAGGLGYCQGLLTQAPGIKLALSGLGAQGLAAGMLANGNPIGTVLAAGLTAHLANGANSLDTAVFSPEVGEWIVAQILYLSAAGMLTHAKKDKGGRSV